MKCRKCKKEIPDESKFCLHCGAKQNDPKRRKDGLLEKSITLNGKRKTFYAKTARELNKKIAEFAAEGEAGKTKTFSYYADLFEESFDSLEFNSVKVYRPALKRCVDHFGESPVGEISALEIKRFLDARCKKYASKTVNTHRSMISQVLDLAVLDGAIKSNPATFNYRNTGAKKVIRQAATEEQAETIRQYWNEDLFSWLGYFIMNTGLRKGEALALQYKDIKDKTITVAKSVYYIGSNPHIKEPKTSAGLRTVVLPDCVAEKMKEGKPRDYIFSSNGEILSDYSVQKGWRSFCERHGMGHFERDVTGSIYFLPDVTLHQLRHYYATKCYEAGIDKLTVQEMMGHTDYGTTEIYTHIREEAIEAARAKINSSP